MSTAINHPGRKDDVHALSKLFVLWMSLRSTESWLNTELETLPSSKQAASGPFVLKRAQTAGAGNKSPLQRSPRLHTAKDTEGHNPSSAVAAEMVGRKLRGSKRAAPERSSSVTSDKHEVVDASSLLCIEGVSDNADKSSDIALKPAEVMLDGSDQAVKDMQSVNSNAAVHTNVEPPTTSSDDTCCNAQEAHNVVFPNSSTTPASLQQTQTKRTICSDRQRRISAKIPRFFFPNGARPVSPQKQLQDRVLHEAVWSRRIVAETPRSRVSGILKSVKASMLRTARTKSRYSSASQANEAKLLGRLPRTDAVFAVHDFFPVTQLICGMSAYLNTALFCRVLSWHQEKSRHLRRKGKPSTTKLQGNDDPNTLEVLNTTSLSKRRVSREQFEEYWRAELRHATPVTRVFRVLKHPQLDFLRRCDFQVLLEDVVNRHPGLQFLRGSAEFQLKYAQTVIARIFYSVNVSGSERITLREMRKSNLCAVLDTLHIEDDINRIHDYFSYEHFYVIYLQFWELDTDQDQLLSAEDLLRYDNGGLTRSIVDRIMAGKGRPLLCRTPGRMNYDDFVTFFISEVDKTTAVGTSYWFRCLDISGNSVISPNEMAVFFVEQKERLQALTQESVQFRDVLCQLVDMIKPLPPTSQSPVRFLRQKYLQGPDFLAKNASERGSTGVIDPALLPPGAGECKKSSKMMANTSKFGKSEGNDAVMPAPSTSSHRVFAPRRSNMLDSPDPEGARGFRSNRRFKTRPCPTAILAPRPPYSSNFLFAQQQSTVSSGLGNAPPDSPSKVFSMMQRKSPRRMTQQRSGNGLLTPPASSLGRWDASPQHRSSRHFPRSPGPSPQKHVSVSFEGFQQHRRDMLKYSGDFAHFTVDDLLRSSMSALFFDVLFNVNRFFQSEQRDPMRIKQMHEEPDMSVWTRYALSKYYELAMGNNSGGGGGAGGSAQHDAQNAFDSGFEDGSDFYGEWDG